MATVTMMVAMVADAVANAAKVYRINFLNV